MAKPPVDHIPTGGFVIRGRAGSRSPTDDLLFEAFQIDKLVGLPAHQDAKVTIAREEHDLIDILRDFHCADCDLYVHVSLNLALARGVGELLDRLGDYGEAVILQPIEQRSDRTKLRVVVDRGVVERAKDNAKPLEGRQQTIVVDVEPESLPCRVKISAIDKQRSLPLSVSHDLPIPISISYS
jgi:hypothetical protein